MIRTMTALAALGLFTLAASPALAIEPWEQAIATGLGKAGAEMPGGVYRVGLPRTDLKVTLDGVALKPTLALGSWLAFEKHGAGPDVMAMGDLVLTDSEVNPVMTRLLESGIKITALHNHLLRSSLNTMYLHVSAMGEPGKVAKALRAALDASSTPFPATPPIPGAAPAPAATDAPLDMDTAGVEHALGRKGKINSGVYAFSIPGAAPPRDNGMVVPEAMGGALAINFQPTGGGKAAITGDLVLTADEVNPVLRALRANGIEVTALHNHMLDDQPRMFFMHFWANDDAVKLAKGLAAALAKVKIAAAK